MKVYPASSLPRLFSEAFKRECLQQLVNGRSLRQTSALMGVATGTLERWKQTSGPAKSFPGLKPDQIQGHSVGQMNQETTVFSLSKPLNPNHSHYEAAFKQRALSKLASGRSVTQVARSMTVPVDTLLRWRKLACETVAASLNSLYEENSHEAGFDQAAQCR